MPWRPCWQLLGTKMRPKDAQEHPEDAKIRILGPTCLNLAPTWRPTSPKSYPNAAQDPSRSTFTTSLALLSPLSAFALIFIGLFGDFKEFETCKILIFPQENAIFNKIAIFDKNAKNNREILLKPSQNPPKPSPNPPKIHSKSIRNQKKSITTPKKIQEAPKSKK